MNHVRFTLEAAEGSVFHINLAWPQAVPPKEGWPVSYILDEKEFWMALRATQGQTSANTIPQDAEGIVVGISVANAAQRHYAYTPLIDRSYAATLQPEGSGGFGFLADLLINEIAPTIEQALPVNPLRRSLCGHSLAGLFVSHYMLTAPISFNRYVISSPSVWWSDFYLLNHASQCLSLRRFHPGAEVYISVGQYEQGLGPADQALPQQQQMRNQQRRQQRRMVDGARELAHALRAYSCFNLYFEVVAEADHGNASATAWRRLFS